MLLYQDDYPDRETEKTLRTSILLSMLYYSSFFLHSPNYSIRSIPFVLQTTFPINYIHLSQYIFININTMDEDY